MRLRLRSEQIGPVANTINEEAAIQPTHEHATEHLQKGGQPSGIRNRGMRGCLSADNGRDPSSQCRRGPPLVEIFLVILFSLQEDHVGMESMLTSALSSIATSGESAIGFLVLLVHPHLNC